MAVRSSPRPADGRAPGPRWHAYLVYDQSFNFYMTSNPATLLLVK